MGVDPRMVPKRLGLAVLAAGALLSSAFGQQKEGELSLAMSGAFQPFSITDTEGNLVGFDADIAKEIARRMDLEPELVQIDWAGIQAGLQTKQYDLICGSMAITDERLQTMHFSLPYYVSGAQLFALKGVEGRSNLRLGVTEDSTYAAYIEEHPEEFPGARVIPYGSEAEIVAAMQTDKIDAFVSDRIVGGFYAQKAGNGEIVPVGDLLYQEACGIAARQESAALVHRVNEALFEMIQDGTYAQIYEQWVGFPPNEQVLLSSWGEYEAKIPPLSGGTAATEPQAETEFVEDVSGMVPLLAKGAAITIILSVLTAVISLFTGTLIGIGAMAKNGFVRSICSGYTTLLRGTPLLVQLFISYFVIATWVNRLAGFELMGAFAAALLALVANTTAYNAETIRGGIGSVDAGQWDAGATIGMQRSMLLKRIILPQAFRHALPSLGNNLVVLIKDTSLVGAITVIELTYSARNIVFQTGQAFTPFLAAAVFYLVIISLVTLGSKALEKRLGQSARKAGAA